jgi:hypothetical protein
MYLYIPLQNSRTQTVTVGKNGVNGHNVVATGTAAGQTLPPEKKKPGQSARGWPKDPGNSE